MKPLTEVIEDAERCLLPFPGDCLNCPHFDSTDDDLGYDCQKKILRDAVGYLREYQRYQNTPSRIGHMAMVDLEDNTPLTWDELLQMEGKPVWVVNTINSVNINEWLLFSGLRSENLAVFIDRWGSKTIGEKVTFGVSWQAYRKER